MPKDLGMIIGKRRTVVGCGKSMLLSHSGRAYSQIFLCKWIMSKDHGIIIGKRRTIVGCGKGMLLSHSGRAHSQIF